MINLQAEWGQNGSSEKLGNPHESAWRYNTKYSSLYFTVIENKAS